MIFIDRDWGSEINKQAEDRILRIGQKNNCQYWYLIADHPVEDRVTELLQRKELLVERTISKLVDAPEKTLTLREILDAIILHSSEHSR